MNLIVLIAKPLILLLILFTTLIIVQKKPDFYYWLFLMLFFDSGGFFAGYFGNELFARINFSDILFVIMMMAFFSKSVDKSIVYHDEKFLKFVKYFLFFQIYFVLVYGLLVPAYYDRLNFTNYLIKNRMFFMSLPILIATYVFAIRNLTIFFNMIVFFAVIILTLFMITLLTGIQIIPYYTLDRYGNSGMLRICMLSYGLIDLILNIALIVYLLNRKFNFKIKYQKWIYYSGILMATTFLLTLTRRAFIGIIFGAVIIIFILSYIFRISKLKFSFKIIVPVLAVVVVLSVSFPKNLNYITNVYKDVFLLVTGRSDTRGVRDYRIAGAGDLILTKQIISENIFFGTGYIPIIWKDGVQLKQLGDTFDRALDAGGEMPLYGLFMTKGIIGFLIYLPGLFMILRLVKKILLFLKTNNQLLLENLKKEDLILLILFSGLVVQRCTFGFLGMLGSSFLPYIAILYAGNRKMQNLENNQIL